MVDFNWYYDQNVATFAIKLSTGKPAFMFTQIKV